MKPIVKNIFNNIPHQIPEELFQTLYTKECIKIERIVSKAHSSSVNHWYDQIQDEWIILLKGQAKLQLSDLSLIFLTPGDTLLIPAHTKHRVHWTDSEIETIWLAIHIFPNH